MPDPDFSADEWASQALRWLGHAEHWERAAAHMAEIGQPNADQLHLAQVARDRLAHCRAKHAEGIELERLEAVLLGGAA